VTTTESKSETPARRVRVTYEPTPGSKPWRAVIEAVETDEIKMPAVPVGRFDSQHEAATTGVSALRFVNAGIAWRPVGVEVDQ
jgi:hypothetical protein